MKRLAAVLALCLGACVKQLPPEIVTVYTPYVAVVPLEPADALRLYGRTDCDMNDKPYKRVNVSLSREQRGWVELHENTHVTQVWEYPFGCKAFVVRYNADQDFKLAVEAAAFCTVYSAQLRAKVKPDPSPDVIIRLLMSDYKATWSTEEIRKAMPCWTG